MHKKNRKHAVSQTASPSTLSTSTPDDPLTVLLNWLQKKQYSVVNMFSSKFELYVLVMSPVGDYEMFCVTVPPTIQNAVELEPNDNIADIIAPSVMQQYKLTSSMSYVFLTTKGLYVNKAYNNKLAVASYAFKSPIHMYTAFMQMPLVHWAICCNRAGRTLLNLLYTLDNVYADTHIFLNALEKCEDVYAMLANNNKKYTVLVPKMQAIPNKKDLSSIVCSHIIEGFVALDEKPQTVQTITGIQLTLSSTVCISPNKTKLNMVAVNGVASNGYVHVLDGMLPPKNLNVTLDRHITVDPTTIVGTANTIDSIRLRLCEANMKLMQEDLSTMRNILDTMQQQFSNLVDSCSEISTSRLNYAILCSGIQEIPHINYYPPYVCLPNESHATADVLPSDIDSDSKIIVQGSTFEMSLDSLIQSETRILNDQIKHKHHQMDNYEMMTSLKCKLDKLLHCMKEIAANI